MDERTHFVGMIYKKFDLSKKILRLKGGGVKLIVLL